MALVEAVAGWSTPGVQQLLHRLSQDPHADVREAGRVHRTRAALTERAPHDPDARTFTVAPPPGPLSPVTSSAPTPGAGRSIVSGGL
ncbi:hypothetical protein ACFRCW_27800 [Streptomyces sp. NPDC056653]|uniref:hypothetical protein n=1 Tax=Streptomyces sp. NPDC056653 TaxID=3345894 RepID=UPI00369D9EEB